MEGGVRKLLLVCHQGRGIIISEKVDGKPRPVVAGPQLLSTGYPLDPHVNQRTDAPADLVNKWQSGDLDK